MSQKELINTDDTPELSFTVKNYHGHGISNRFFDEKLNREKYEIKGPMGKGLGLDENSKGTHIAFMAGTGALILIDLAMR